jgi:serine protease AprX
VIAVARPSTTVRDPLAEDPFDLIHTARVRKGKISKLTVGRIPWHAFSTEPFEKKRGRDRERRRRPQKIHPVLTEWLRERSPDDTEQLLVNLRDDVQIPKFPDPNPDGRRSASENRRARGLAQRLTKEITAQRADRYEELTRELRELKAKPLERFWIINGLLVEMKLGMVEKLAERDDVLFVEPRFAGEEPPQNTNPNDDVDDGRARLVSDPYFNLGQSGGWLGLLDTGLRFTHTQFNSPSTIAFRRDCVNGGADCNTGTGLNPNDDCWNHGTSSAAIITGNANQGGAFRGVTGITLDSFKVYPTTFSGGTCTGGLDGAAAVRGFQAAVAVLDRVIVAEMQGNGDDLSSISTAADNAFDAGAVIIAANGNNGPNASTVNTPANAHRVIGVGNFDVQTQNQIAGQSRGPAPDGRFKPDIQAPTNTETASNASDTAFRVFGGTSGATPYAAGAAALLRNWLRGSNFSIDPGQVYAQLILSGQQPYPFNNTSGAGPIRLPTDGWAWWGKVSVGNGATIDIPLNVGGGRPNTFDGALWWPEWAFRLPLFGRFEIHNDIDLYLVDPAGAVRASSISIPSVFERVRVSGAVTPGTWKLRIRGYNVPGGLQTVYWAAHVRLS